MEDGRDRESQGNHLWCNTISQHQCIPNHIYNSLTSVHSTTQQAQGALPVDPYKTSLLGIPNETVLFIFLHQELTHRDTICLSRGLKQLNKAKYQYIFPEIWDYECFVSLCHSYLYLSSCSLHIKMLVNGRSDSFAFIVSLYNIHILLSLEWQYTVAHVASL